MTSDSPYLGVGVAVVPYFGAFLIICAATYTYASSGEWNHCIAKYDVRLSGEVCHRSYFMGLVFSSVASIWSAFMFERARRVVRRALRIADPHVIVNDTPFWCEQLLEPIDFGNVLQQQVQRGRAGTLMNINFVLSYIPTLAYGELYTKPSYGKCAYSFSAPGFSDRVGVLAAAIDRIKASPKAPTFVNL